MLEFIRGALVAVALAATALGGSYALERSLKHTDTVVITPPVVQPADGPTIVDFLGACDHVEKIHLGTGWIGTGFLMKGGYVVTAGHVAREVLFQMGRNPELRPTWRGLDLTLVAACDDPNVDVALYSVEGVPADMGLELGEDVGAGRRVWLAGFPMGNKTVSVGQVIKPTDEDFPGLMYAEYYAASGASGAPVFSWENDRLVVVGVHCRGWEQSDIRFPLSLFSHISHVKKAIESAEAAKSKP